MKITVETIANTTPDRAWEAYNTPTDIVQWNSAQDDWHTTRSTVDLREGGTYSSRMEAKDGSMGFDFEGTYTRVVPGERIEYRMADGREVEVTFTRAPGGVRVQVTFDAESENPAEMQRQGWQAILDNYARHAATRA
jgi:uncharacterized protein YndB with AHSA1/START domain